MKCPDCKGSRQYLPLFGPAEVCRGCQGFGEVDDPTRPKTAMEIHMRSRQSYDWEGTDVLSQWLAVVTESNERWNFLPVGVYNCVPFQPPGRTKFTCPVTDSMSPSQVLWIDPHSRH